MSPSVPFTPETIPPHFLSRYFERNAEQRYLMQVLEFMLWRRGRMILPQHRARVMQEFLQEEMEDFFARGIFRIPQIQFLLTTRCSLRCKNCNAYMPSFGAPRGHAHHDISPEDFRRDMERLATAVNGIRRFILIGGEPLLHPQLAAIVEIAVKSPLVSVVEIITNGTLVPPPELLDVLAKYRDRVYFHISNYMANSALAPRLKHEALLQALKAHGIPHQMAPAPVWQEERPLAGRLDDAAVRALFDSCWIKRCVQALDGQIAICPKASCGYELGMAEKKPGELVDLRSGEDLRAQLLAFYQKPFFDVCRGCARIDKEVLVAEQL